MSLHIYILNLPRSAHRRIFMTQQLDALGVQYTFVDAVDGRDMAVSEFSGYNSAVRIQKYGRDLKNTEIATSVSHLKALSMAYHTMKTQDWAVVLEDDITVLPCFTSALKTLETYPDTVHAVRLYNRVKDTTQTPDCMDESPMFRLKRSTYTNWGGALAYAVRVSAIPVYQNNNTSILHIADKMLFGIPYDGIRLYQHYPRSVCTTDGVVSDIGYDRGHVYKGVRNNVVRFVFRLREYVGRVWYIIRHMGQYF